MHILVFCRSQDILETQVTHGSVVVVKTTNHSLLETMIMMIAMGIVLQYIAVKSFRPPRHYSIDSPQIDSPHIDNFMFVLIFLSDPLTLEQHNSRFGSQLISCKVHHLKTNSSSVIYHHFAYNLVLMK